MKNLNNRRTIPGFLPTAFFLVDFRFAGLDFLALGAIYSWALDSR
jgi:hypothetical protein